MGNDFDRWEVSAVQWLMGKLRVGVGFSRTRKGEGSLFTPWDAPWLDYTVEEGYSEPFPTGIVETSSQFDLSVQFIPSLHWGVQAELHARSRSNADHVEGVEKSETLWRIGVWLDGDVLFSW
jgi:hypothetical protein